MVIAEPEITVLKIEKDHDFIVMGSDGVFDRMESVDVVNCIWK